MPFTTNMTGTTQVDDSLIVEFDQQFIIAAAQEQVMEQFVTYKQVIGGKSVDFEKYAQMSLATTPLTEDEDATSEALQDENILITPQEYGNVVTKTKLASLQTGGKVDLAAARLTGINMGRSMDKLAVLRLEAGTNEIFPGTVASEANVTSTDVMTTTFLNKLYNKLSRTNIIPLSEGMYVAVMHEDVIYDLRNSVGSGSWQDISKYSRPEEVLKNEVGMLAGFRIIRDNHVSINADAGDGTTDTYHTLCMGFNALGKAVSEEPQGKLTGPFDKLGRFVNVGWYGCYEYKIVDSDALWMGTTASSVGNNA
jgi:N4-gp56 family major capsid protein